MHDEHPIGESIASDVRRAHADAWHAFHYEGGPNPNETRPTDAETIPADCTGYIDDLGHLAHDGDTCPVHETARTPLLDQLASLARTALDDPGGLPAGEPFSTVGPQHSDADALRLYAIHKLDELIGAINPAELTPESAARALSILARHVADIGRRLDSEGITEAGRSMIGGSLTAAVDELGQTVSLLTGDAE
jgi:hypothetical protein